MTKPMRADFLVIGAGVAGLRAAIELARSGDVLVVAKDSLRESSSEYAQGGVAVALSEDDEGALHVQDTLNAGDGLCSPNAVNTLVEEGPQAILELIDWGMEFDREGTKLSFTREAAHSRNRILHAHGDSTGREMSKALYHKAASIQNIRFQSFSAVTDLLVEDGEVTGAIACDEASRRSVPIYASAVLLATGGLGAVFKETTNPLIATGDGVAVAWRAGAAISDLEFVQFHPTALHASGVPRFLLSEALRGEGAKLRNIHGELFMARYHPMEELAPRDVVSRAIFDEIRKTGAEHVLLDLTHRDAAFIRKRFPRIYETCLQFGVDITKQPAPVHPAAHYAMGGVRTDLEGQTSSKGLFAAGEAACTGVHGANRLASNSLLEALVFGRRAGAKMLESARGVRETGKIPEAPAIPECPASDLQELAWKYCSIVRSGDGLRQVLQQLESMGQSEASPHFRRSHETRNIHTVIQLIARCALAREESRGAHCRLDFPAKRTEFEKHSFIQKAGEVRFE